MLVTVSSGPAYALAYVKLAVGESVFAERGAMVSMSMGMEVAATTGGGVVRAAIRKALVKESFFFARFTAHVHGAWVALAPRFPGDVLPVPISEDDPLCVQSGSLLGYAESVEVSTGAGSLQQVILREGATVLRCSGQGDVLVCSYGGIEVLEVAAGQQLVVDSGHLVAWSASMPIRVGPLAGVMSSAMTGEGLVGALTGPGRVLVQTRAEQQLLSWLFPDRSHDKR